MVKQIFGNVSLIETFVLKHSINRKKRFTDKKNENLIHNSIGSQHRTRRSLGLTKGLQRHLMTHFRPDVLLRAPEILRRAKLDTQSRVAIFDAFWQHFAALAPPPEAALPTSQASQPHSLTTTFPTRQTTRATRWP
jgi:hypothetical protein